MKSSSAFLARALLLALSLASAASAQHALFVPHDGNRMRPVVAASGNRPCVLVDGKRVVSSASRFVLQPVQEFLPVFVSVRGLKVSTFSLNLVQSGAQINHEFHVRGDFTSPTPLDDVFLVLELEMENGDRNLYLHEIGRLEAGKTRSLQLVARVGYNLGTGRRKLHLFSGGLELLHSDLPFATREGMLDRLIARRSADRPDGPPDIFMGIEPEYPKQLLKTKARGQALVRARVRSSGAVSDAEVVSASEPAFGEAALAAVRQWRFFPRKKGGRAVESQVDIPITFTPPPA